MPLLARLLAFIVTPVGTLGAAAAGVLVLVASFAMQQQSVGARKQAARQEKTDATVVKNAAEAGRRAADPAARGVLDPYARTK